MRFYDAQAVHHALDYPLLIHALVDAHQSDVDLVPSVMMEQATASGSTACFLALPAWQKQAGLGAKLVTVFPDNEKNGSGLPSVQGVYILFNGHDGSPVACIDGTALTLRKTAADSATGAHFLARKDAERMLMVGAGALGPHLIMAHIAARPSIKQVTVWNRSPERARKLANNLELPGVTIKATTKLESAARSADIISCATMATEPLIKGDWLTPGTHVDLVGSYRTDMRECDEITMARSSVYTDSPWSAMRDCGEITSALASGALAVDAIRGDLFSLSRNECEGRTSSEEITLFKNGGGGHLDLMVARYLCEMDEEK